MKDSINLVKVKGLFCRDFHDKTDYIDLLKINAKIRYYKDYSYNTYSSYDTSSSSATTRYNNYSSSSNNSWASSSLGHKTSSQTLNSAFPICYNAFLDPSDKDVLYFNDSSQDDLPCLLTFSYYQYKPSKSIQLGNALAVFSSYGINIKQQDAFSDESFDKILSTQGFSVSLKKGCSVGFAVFVQTSDNPVQYKGQCLKKSKTIVVCFVRNEKKVSELRGNVPVYLLIPKYNNTYIPYTSNIFLHCLSRQQMKEPNDKFYELSSQSSFVYKESRINAYTLSPKSQVNKSVTIDFEESDAQASKRVNVCAFKTIDSRRYMILEDLDDQPAMVHAPKSFDGIALVFSDKNRHNEIACQYRAKNNPSLDKKFLDKDKIFEHRFVYSEKTGTYLIFDLSLHGLTDFLIKNFGTNNVEVQAI